MVRGTTRVVCAIAELLVWNRPISVCLCQTMHTFTLHYYLILGGSLVSPNPTLSHRRCIYGAVAFRTYEDYKIVLWNCYVIIIIIIIIIIIMSMSVRQPPVVDDNCSVLTRGVRARDNSGEFIYRPGFSISLSCDVSGSPHTRYASIVISLAIQLNDARCNYCSTQHTSVNRRCVPIDSWI